MRALCTIETKSSFDQRMDGIPVAPQGKKVIGKGYAEPTAQQRPVEAEACTRGVS